MQILHPIPDRLLPCAGALWRMHFGLWRWPASVDAAHGLAAVDAAGNLRGVMGIRDASGGFAQGTCRVPDWLFRPAPPTSDLVIDGLAVTDLRQGTGRALMDAAQRLAIAAGRPGLRAEVRDRNRDAMAFYDRVGFQAVGCGRYGLPWWGQVHLLRLVA